MGVDHAAGAGSSMRGKSGAAASIPCAARVRPYATPSQSSSAGWPSASRMRRGRVRDVGGERDRDRAEAVDEVVEHPVELVGARLVLRQLPRRGRLDVPVECAHDLPDPLERARQVEGVEPRRDVVAERLQDRRDGRSADGTARSVPSR